jgi:hypothetical protein
VGTRLSPSLRPWQPQLSNPLFSDRTPPPALPTCVQDMYARERAHTMCLVQSKTLPKFFPTVSVPLVLVCTNDFEQGIVVHGTPGRAWYPRGGPGVARWSWVAGADTSPFIVSRVSGLSAIAISAGEAHTCAISTGGGVKCWGWNVFGQLGIGSTTNQYSPMDVAGGGLFICLMFSRSLARSQILMRLLIFLSMAISLSASLLL